MKRILLLCIVLFICASSFAQQKNATVTLKNGTTLTGAILELNPTSHITISIAGFETKISMSEIESISETGFDTKDSNFQVEAITASGYTDLDINETEEDYPQTFLLEVGPYKIEMTLVKGATFNMGYDGNGSRAMNSEPIHEVTLSSFYVNTKPISKEIASFLKKGSGAGKSESTYHPSEQKDALAIVDKIAEIAEIPVGLITEAQWEYIATRSEFFALGETAFCYDYYGEYSPVPQKDPIGPKKGRSSVIRKMSDDSRIYARLNTYNSPQYQFFHFAIRFTCPAAAIK